MPSERFARDIHLPRYAEKEGYRPVERESHAAVSVLTHPETAHTIAVSRDARADWRYDTIGRLLPVPGETSEAKRERIEALCQSLEAGDITDFVRRRHPTETPAELHARLSAELREAHRPPSDRDRRAPSTGGALPLEPLDRTLGDG